MLCSRFLDARSMALFDMSTPHNLKSRMRWHSSECRRYEMQPVPVHRSRIPRRCGADLDWPSNSLGSKEARRVVIDSVSDLYMIFRT